MTDTTKNTHQESIVKFLRSIGLDVREVPAAKGFIPYIEIQDGILFYDHNAEASSLLHEAGHLAILTGDARSHCGSDVSSVQRLMFDAYSHLEPDHPALRVALQSGDCEATAWAWAAGRHLGIPDEDIIQDHEYEGEGDDVRLRLQLNAYFGINGLRATGICHSGKDGYPRLNYWLQPDFGIIPPISTRSPSLK